MRGHLSHPRNRFVNRPFFLCHEHRTSTLTRYLPLDLTLYRREMQQMEYRVHPMLPNICAFLNQNLIPALQIQATKITQWAPTPSTTTHRRRADLLTKLRVGERVLVE